MIIDNSKSELEIYGDIEEIQTSINKEDLDFIITLLSSNQYSNPEASFLREITSNAWDSHVAANNTDQPIIITIDDYISIRDYGTGLSKQDFEKLYCSIGSSTKRYTNDFIGGFGLGHMTPLAVSDTVEINDYFDGTLYHYIMIKDGNKITTTLIGTEPTDEHNGLEIRIDDLGNKHNKFLGEIKNLCFFPNVYIVNNSEFNNNSIKKYKNFWVNKNYSVGSILLGNVIYPLNYEIVDKDIKNFMYYLQSSGAAFKFEIGDLDVTPNREEIIYNDTTIKLINDKIKNAYNEVIELIKNVTDVNFDNIRDWHNHTYNKTQFDLLSAEVSKNYNRNTLSQMHDYFQYTYKDKSLSFDTNYILTRSFRNGKAYFYNDKFYSKMPSSAERKFSIISCEFLVVEGRLDWYKKDYIKENYNGKCCIILSDVSDFSKGLSDIISDPDVINIILNDIKPEILNISKPEKSKKKKQENNLTFKLHYYHYCWQTAEISDFNLFINDKFPNKGVLLLSSDESDKELAQTIKRNFNYGIIWCAKKYYQKLLEHPRVFTLEKFIKRHERDIAYSNYLINDSYDDIIRALVPNIEFPKNYYYCNKFPEQYISSELKEEVNLINKYINAINEVCNMLHIDQNGYGFELPYIAKYIIMKMFNLKISNKELIKINNDKIVKLCTN